MGFIYDNFLYYFTLDLDGLQGLVSGVDEDVRGQDLLLDPQVLGLPLRGEGDQTVPCDQETSQTQLDPHFCAKSIASLVDQIVMDLERNKTKNYDQGEIELGDDILKNSNKNRKPAEFRKHRSQSKKMKSLQIDRKENMKMFGEKIVLKDGGYVCKCGKFSSGLRLKAISHTIKCGKTINRNIKSKAVECLECREVFQNQRQLDSHFRTVHEVSCYSCSKCYRKFQLKTSYMKHLLHHDENYKPRFSCAFCDHISHGSWHLKRHIKRNHKAMIASIAIVDHVLDMAFQSQKSTYHDIPEVGSDLATLEVESILLADQVPSEVETTKFYNN